MDLFLARTTMVPSGITFLVRRVPGGPQGLTDRLGHGCLAVGGDGGFRQPEGLAQHASPSASHQGCPDTAAEADRGGVHQDHPAHPCRPSGDTRPAAGRASQEGVVVRSCGQPLHLRGAGRNPARTGFLARPHYRLDALYDGALHRLP